MINIKKKVESKENFKAIRKYIPDDHSKPQDPYSYVRPFASRLLEGAQILDLGCGAGDSIDLFRQLSPDAIWYGVDIEHSPEVQRRVRESEQFSSFNGIDLPYSDSKFDLIFCHQVLEHVRYPDQLIIDALRVLKPGGYFVGSVSYLEPYHSYSIFNFTPYGIIRVFCDAGFDLVEIRPGADASMLINRLLLNRSRLLRPLWNHNFLFGISGIIGFLFNLGHRERNFLSIQFSGHLIFSAQRPDSP